MDIARDYRADFDHTDPTFHEHLAEISADLRQHCPVARAQAHGGFWVLSRYQDITRVVRDSTAFSCQAGTSIPPREDGVPNLPFDSDPPEHSRYRSVLAPWLTAPQVSQYEPAIRQLVTALINDFIEQGACDCATALAIPLSASVIGLAMGIDAKEWPQLTQHMQGILMSVVAQDHQENRRRRMSLMHTMFRQIERRRVKPRDDLLSALVVSQSGGTPLTEEEIVSLTVSLLTAGLEPVVMLLGSMLLHLAEHPGDRQRLIDAPALIPPFIDESLRYYAPVQYVGRNVAQATTIDGQAMQPGERVFLLLGSANRDGAYFPDADQFVLDRKPNRHIAFSHGAHFCLGAPLTRLELRVALEELLRRIPAYQLAAPARRSFPTGEIYGVLDLPIVFPPGRVEQPSTS